MQPLKPPHLSEHRELTLRFCELNNSYLALTACGSSSAMLRRRSCSACRTSKDSLGGSWLDRLGSAMCAQATCCSASSLKSPNSCSTQRAPSTAAVSSVSMSIDARDHRIRAISCTKTSNHPMFWFCQRERCSCGIRQDPALHFAGFLSRKRDALAAYTRTQPWTKRATASGKPVVKCRDQCQVGAMHCHAICWIVLDTHFGSADKDGALDEQQQRVQQPGNASKPKARACPHQAADLFH